MKNKLLVSVFTVALVALSFTSCKEKTDFDAIVDQISGETLKGYFSGAEADANDLVLHIAQYQFMDDNSVKRTLLSLGDGVNGEPVTTNFTSWSIGDFNNGGKGRYLTLYPEAEGEDPLVVNFIDGGIVEENQPAALDKNNKVKDLLPAQDKMINKHWACNDTTWDRKDTIVTEIQYDTTYTYKPKKDPETGKTMRDSLGHIIYEQTIKEITEKEVEKKIKKNVTPTKIEIRDLELFRDETTYENIGVWHLVSKQYEVKNHVPVEQKKDSTVDFTFRWCFESFSSASAFVIKARQDNGTEELFEIRYDDKVPSITLQQLILKIVEE